MWDPKAASWNDFYNALLEYVEKNDSLPKRGFVTESGLKLGDWVQSSRSYIRSNRMPAEKVQLLGKVPQWQTGNLHETLFNSNVLLLKKYVEQHGRLPGPSVKEEGVNLGQWVSRQRRLQVAGKLPKKRQRALEEIPGWWWAES